MNRRKFLEKLVCTAGFSLGMSSSLESSLGSGRYQKYDEAVAELANDVWKLAIKSWPDILNENFASGYIKLDSLNIKYGHIYASDNLLSLTIIKGFDNKMAKEIDVELKKVTPPWSFNKVEFTMRKYYDKLEFLEIKVWRVDGLTHQPTYKSKGRDFYISEEIGMNKGKRDIFLLKTNEFSEEEIKVINQVVYGPLLKEIKRGLLKRAGIKIIELGKPVSPREETKEFIRKNIWKF